MVSISIAGWCCKALGLGRKVRQEVLFAMARARGLCVASHVPVYARTGRGGDRRGPPSSSSSSSNSAGVMRTSCPCRGSCLHVCAARRVLSCRGRDGVQIMYFHPSPFSVISKQIRTTGLRASSSAHRRSPPSASASSFQPLLYSVFVPSIPRKLGLLTYCALYSMYARGAQG